MTSSKAAKTTRFSVSIVAAVCAALLLAAPAQAEIKKSIAVAPISSTAGTVSWINGEAIQAQLITELTKSGRYRVVERENIKGILGEQDMGTAGRTRGKSSPKVGDIEGAQLMIKGVITDAEEESGKSGSAGFKGIGIGGKKTVYRVTMDFRIYDMQTSLILATAVATAEQVKKGKSGRIGIGGLRLGGSKTKGDTTGAIVRSLIKQALEAIDKEAEKLGWKSRVNSVKGDKIVIIGGKRDGLETGMRMEVFELGEQILDEDTGEVLDEGEETKVGEIELTKIKEKVAYASKVSGKAPEKGNVVRLITK